MRWLFTLEKETVPALKETGSAKTFTSKYPRRK